MELRTIAREKLEERRKKYRAYLGIPVIPDFHEALYQMGQTYMVEDVGQILGYVTLTKETLLPGIAPAVPEFFLDVEQTKYARRLLELIIQKMEPATIIGRTDDTRGFPLLMDLRIPNQVAYSLYLLEREPHWSEDDYLTIEESTLDDAQDLLPIYASFPPEDGGMPDEIALTKSLALWRHYRLRVHGAIQAVCYVVPQIQRYMTVSTLVLEKARNKGYGRYLTAYAVKREINEGKLFVAVSNPENDAARGVIESLGARLTGHYMYFRP
ncbi:GNAT family N-acetyltransferase [candidate division FCPU426 bacterium]|nr:GNAT family N-acetyltransferase [candidate division FCPU426 bacterium]